MERRPASGVNSPGFLTLDECMLGAVVQTGDRITRNDDVVYNTAGIQCTNKSANSYR